MAATKSRATLSERQQKFVAYKLAGNSNIEAARLAGYKQPKVSAEANMRRPEIIEALRKAQAKVAKKAEVTVERLVAEYAKIAFGDVRNVAKWGPDGVTPIASEELDDEAAGAISEVSERRTKYGTSLSVKLHDKKGALDSLAKHLGMFEQPLEVDDITGLTPEQVAERRDSRLAALRDRLRARRDREADGDMEASDVPGVPRPNDPD